MVIWIVNVLRSCLLLFASAFMADALLCLALSNCPDDSGGGGDLHIHIGAFSEPSVSPLGGGVGIQAAPSRRVAVWALSIWRGARQEKDKKEQVRGWETHPRLPLLVWWMLFLKELWWSICQSLGME